MFQDDYRNEMDKVKPSPAALQKIQAQISDGTAGKRMKRRTVQRICYAAVACILVLCMVYIPTHSTKKQTVSNRTVQTVGALNVAGDYQEVYRAIRKVNNPFGLKKQVDYVTDGFVEESAPETDSNSAKESNTDGSYTETNTQVAGVDEADIIKTDGKYIYSLSNGTAEIRIFSAENGVLKLIGKITPNSEKSYSFDQCQMFLAENRLTVIYSQYSEVNCVSEENDSACSINIVGTYADVYDVSNPVKPQKVSSFFQSGYYNDSRMVGNDLYLISNQYVGTDIHRRKPETYVPTVGCTDKIAPIEASRIYLYPDDSDYSFYTVIGSFNTETGKKTDAASVLGSTDSLYCSTENLILARCEYNNTNETTLLTRFSMTDGKISLAATGRIDGHLLNQFSMDEYKGNFRFVTTVVTYRNESFKGIEYSSVSLDSSCAKLTVLDSELKAIGQIDNLAPGEQVYSVRFMGDTAYFVTFRQTDPLFSVDLSDAENPKILGQLKIPGFSNFLFPYGDGTLLGIGMDADEQTGRTECVKISLFDIHDPANVTETDKYRLENIAYSDALYDHKATLVDYNRKIVAFNGYDNNGNVIYAVFNAADGFKQVAAIRGDFDYQTRGIIIGSYLYVIGYDTATSYSLNDYTEISRITP